MGLQKTSIKIALDWTPNVVHTGLLVALEKGFYKEAGFDVELISPADDAYATTPARKLTEGQVDLAICPCESVIAYHDKEQTASARHEAVFALQERDASVILCRPGIDSPRGLDGRMYGSYNARYEDEIVRAMIQNDGGKGDFTIVRETAKLSLYASLVSEEPEIDATWVFSSWEGIKAKMAGFPGKQFRLADFGVPYAYSLVIARRAGSAGLSDEVTQKFVSATRCGYTFALGKQAEAVDILARACPEESKAFLSKSLADLTTYWRTDGLAGKMEAARWDAFLAFLRERELLSVDVTSQTLFVSY